MPLDADGEAGRVGNADCLDRAVLRHTFDRDALAGIEDSLPVQRVDANAVASEQTGEVALRHELHLVAVGKHDRGIGVDLAILEARHAMVHAARNVPDLGMQRTAERHVHFLEAAADAEDRHAALNAGLDQPKRHRVAILVIRFVGGMRLESKARRMDIGSCAGEENTVDRAQQGFDVGDVRRAREHQRQGAGDFGDRPHVSLPHKLDIVPVVHDAGIADHPDHGLLGAGNQRSPA